MHPFALGSYSQAPKSILNPRSADAPLSGVLIGWPNGLLMSQPEVARPVLGVLFPFMGACGERARARAML